MADPVSRRKTTESGSSQSLRIPPHSVEAEQSVLGGLMLDNSTWDQVADRINDSDFYRQDHRLIFKAMEYLSSRGQPCDVITVSEYLERQSALDEAGGLAYLGALAKDTPSAANIRAYADIVRERSVLRRLIAAGTRIADSGFNSEGRTPSDLLDEAERIVFEIAELGVRGRQGFTPVKSYLRPTLDHIEHLSQQEGSLTGLATGYEDLDEKTSGLQKGDLVIVAGRPSMGKTTFAMNIAEYAALKHQAPVAIFSMEMPGEQLTLRLMSSLARIDQHRLRTGRLDEVDWPRLTSAVQMLTTVPIYIDDTPALTPTELRARARRLKREHGLGMIVIDYLQLMQVPGTRENRATEISEISRSLKALSKELSIPVVALSQLNRSLEQRPNKRPVMSDLRESGAIEQDADLIMFIYRDEVYNEDTTDKGIAEIIIGKQRNGPIGTVRLTFLGKYTRFENFAPNIYEGGREGS